MLRLSSLLLIVATTTLLDSTAALQIGPQSSARRDFLTQATTIGLASTAFLAHSSPAVAANDDGSADNYTVFKTNSGLQYIELAEGSGIAPRYGQLCSIKYTAYLKLPNKKEKTKFDSDQFLLKHGNGRLIAGLDEGLHTMKEGGKRRLIIPPKLGFVDSGIGPVPQSPFARRQLNQLLEEMVAVRGGNLIYDVELVKVVDDEADQGYYEDSSLTDEQFNTLKENIQKQRGGGLGVTDEAMGEV